MAESGKPEVCMVLKEATIEYTVKNFSKMKDPISSPPYTIQHLPWNVLMKPFYDPDLSKRPFGFFVTCDRKDSTDWTCKADIEFNLRPFNKKFRLPYSRSQKHVFSSANNTAGFDNYILWHELQSSPKSLVSDDTITLEVCITHHPDENEATKADCSVVETVFRHTVKNISKIQNSLILGPFFALNFSWQIVINLSLAPPAQPTSLGLYLQCNKEVFLDTWNCNARVELRLINHQKSDKNLCRILQHSFSSKDNTVGVDDFIQWEKLFDVAEGFLKDDYITVEAYVIPAKFDPQAYLNAREGTFWFKFENVSKTTTENRFSSPCIIGNITWHLVIRQDQKADKEPYLTCYLTGLGINSSTAWSCDVVATIRLLSVKEGQNSFEKELTSQTFGSKKNGWGLISYILWKDLMDSNKGYIKDDSITMEARVKILDKPPETIEIK